MIENLIYEEDYEYTYNTIMNNINIHFDYGRRFHEINMKFLHFHPFYEIYILVQGRAEHVIEGRNFELQEFDIVLLQPYQLHKTNYYKNLSCFRLILSFDLAFFERTFPEVAKEIHTLFLRPIPIYRFEESIKNEFIQHFNRMYLASKKEGSTTDFLVTSYFMQFFTLLLKSQDKNIYSETETPDTLDTKITDIVSYIHQNYANDLSLDFLANTFFISPHYLSKQFKQITHFNLVDYIQQTRVKRAQELLLNTNLKITVISEKCGFGSISQFNRVFHDITQLSPSQFRKSNKLLIQQYYN